MKLGRESGNQTEVFLVDWGGLALHGPMGRREERRCIPLIVLRHLFSLPLRHTYGSV